MKVVEAKAAVAKQEVAVAEAKQEVAKQEVAVAEAKLASACPDEKDMAKAGLDRAILWLNPAIRGLERAEAAYDSALHAGWCPSEPISAVQSSCVALSGPCSSLIVCPPGCSFYSASVPPLRCGRC
eukprot:1033010-Rhodomonas_salina.1